MDPSCWWFFHQRFSWEHCWGWWGRSVDGRKNSVFLWSSTIERFSLCYWAGMNSRRNFLLHNEVHPEPSIRTTYQNCWISAIWPDLSHFSGWGPVWFWTNTWSPTQSGGNCLCCVHRSAARIWWFQQKFFYIHILVNVQLKEQMNRTACNINVLK